MTELNHKTFDIGSVLAGVSFPETEVDVYFDESVGFEIYRAKEALRVAEIKGNEEALQGVITRIEELNEKAAEVRYKIKVRGIPESVRKTCDRRAREKFTVEYSFLGQETPNPDRDDYYNALLWGASLVLITAPDGATAIPNEEHITTLRESVGRSVVSTIAGAISELVKGTKSGFESAAQDTSFLSAA